MEECIYSTNNQVEAKQVSDFLTEKGILNYLKNNHTQNLFGEMQMFTGVDLVAGDIELYVKSEDVNRSLDILTSLFPDNDPNDTETSFPKSEEETPAIIEHHQSDEIRSAIGKAFFLSITSFLISPILFNIKNLIELMHKRRTVFIMLLLINIIEVFITVFFCISSIDSLFTLLVINIIIIPFLLAIKGLSLYIRSKKVISLALFTPLIILILFFFLNKL